MMKHADLCSGIGGFSLGFAWAGLSTPTLFCEQDAWCCKVLNKHWPEVPCYPDVRSLLDDAGRSVWCDILTAGYPCQPFSQAGRRKGDQDSRHIWPEIRNIVQAWRPSWCVFENVYGHVSMGLDTVLDEMDGAGYATKTFVIPAAGVGAPHKRDRVFIVGRLCEDVANTENNGCDRRSEKTGRARPQDLTEQSRLEVRGKPGRHCERSRPADWQTEPAVGRVAHGIPRRVDRIKVLGNAIVPQIAEAIGLAIKESIKHA